MIDVSFGTITQEQADRMVAAAHCPLSGYPAGATEPWIADLVVALLKANGHRTVLETGAFMGHTTMMLALALGEMGGGHLIACEIDPARAAHVRELLDGLGDDTKAFVQMDVRSEDALSVIQSLPDRSLGLAFVDDDHAEEHVEQETLALFPKMVPGGLICYHDVWGSCDLRRVVHRYGGLALDLPRAGPAGGLGIIQVYA